MIYSLNGTLEYTEPGFVVVECGGVGFKCFTSMQTQRSLPSVGKNIKLYTYMSVREDALDLFGFNTKTEMACFKMLISVNGVGAKVAMAILSELSAEQIGMSVASGDYKTLTRASGVGPKLAQRIVLELKDKVKGLGAPVDGDTATVSAVPSAAANPSKAVSALMVLGYQANEATAVVSKFDPSLPVEELIRLSLREMANKF